MIRKPAIILFLGIISTSVTAEGLDRVYVSNEMSDSISVIDLESNTVSKTLPVGDRPRGMALSADHSELYVAVGQEDA
ncbi:MAG: PQQ-dependent catabolism-associated beta-propeller protein, partial [Pseudomonadota bacterium]|nr:PQQ-dependent catabolism-associated beta-propeller protein [Pseudomonadota bacterium]